MSHEYNYTDAKRFVEFYYSTKQRLVTWYNYTEDAHLILNGQHFIGRESVLEKLANFPLDEFECQIATLDNHHSRSPINAVTILITGTFLTDGESKSIPFTQTLQLVRSPEPFIPRSILNYIIRNSTLRVDLEVPDGDSHTKAENFIESYYEHFTKDRQSLSEFYASDAHLIFNGQGFSGLDVIIEKLTNLPFDESECQIKTVDIHSARKETDTIVITATGIFSVHGGSKQLPFTQVFYLGRSSELSDTDNYIYIIHNILRMSLDTLRDPLIEAKTFTQSYYEYFRGDRRFLSRFYAPDAHLIFDDQEFSGSGAIIGKLNNFPFPELKVQVETVAAHFYQPGSSILTIFVTAALLVHGGSKSIPFTQVLQLFRPEPNETDPEPDYLIQNDIIRMNLEAQLLAINETS